MRGDGGDSLHRWVFAPDDGARPVHGGVAVLRDDPAWRDNLAFHEYFHGDDGAGLARCTRAGGRR